MIKISINGRRITIFFVFTYLSQLYLKKYIISIQKLQIKNVNLQIEFKTNIYTKKKIEFKSNKYNEKLCYFY